MQSDFDQYADEIRDGLTGEEWEAPVPFDEVHTPDFPTEKLPGPLAGMVECLAESTQTPEEMSGLLSLGVLATAFQSRYCELQSNINIAELSGQITVKHAWCLRDKYLRIGRPEDNPIP